MPHELEIKFRLADPARLRAMLASQRARAVGRFLERSVILDRPDRTLLAANSALRVRERVSLDTTPATHERLLTFKGPLLDSGAVKQREEIEFPVGDFDATIRLFERLGYRGIICYERRRETWRSGACEVALDELPDASHYVEIEGPSAQAVLTCATALGLCEAERDPVTYVEYAARHGTPACGFDACLAFDDGRA